MDCRDSSCDGMTDIRKSFQTFFVRVVELGQLTVLTLFED